MNVLVALVIVALTLSVGGGPAAAAESTPHPVADASAPWPARARAPPAGPDRLDPAEGPCPIRPHPVPFPELQADGRVHDRMLDPNHRTDYEENEGATTLRDREFS